MFTFVKSELEKISGETGFIQNSLEKMLRLLDVLDQISKHPFLKKCFVLKGGTALNVFFFDLPRLSLDADINYIHALDRDAMQKDRRQIDQLIPDIFSNEYRVAFSKQEYALSQFELRYQTLSGSGDLIKLEINYLHRLPMITPVEKEFKKFGLKIKFSQLGFEELLASKIIAMLSRYTPRDLYDIYLASSNKIKIDAALLRQLILYYALISREDMFDLFKFDLERISNQDIRRHLIPMLINENTPLIDNLKEKVTNFLKPLIQLNDSQIEIIANFYKTGKLQFETLFSDTSLNSKIKIAPAFIWKKTNIEKYYKN